MHVQSCCFAHKTNCFLMLLLLLSSSLLKVPNDGTSQIDYDTRVYIPLLFSFLFVPYKRELRDREGNAQSSPWDM